MISIGQRILSAAFFTICAVLLLHGKPLSEREKEHLEKECASGNSPACLTMGQATGQLDYLESGCRKEYLPACFHLAMALMKTEETRRDGLEQLRQNCFRHDLLACHRLNEALHEARYPFCSHLELNHCRDIMQETARGNGQEATPLQETHCLQALREGCHLLAELTRGSESQQYLRLGCSFGSARSCRALRD
ncbi:MAG: hypothetical protein HS115_14240 [Spirochaetales bacterium]|nr:hypothetical protein [Spirochaetales bacterium]